MKLPLQIRFDDIPQSDAIETAIREKAEKLDRFHPRIMACRVSVHLTRKHAHRGKLYSLHLDVTVPGRELVARREQAEDIYVAIRDAFNDMARQLEEHARARRGEVKAHALPLHGQIARLNADEGFGFILGSDGREFYFARDNLVDFDFDRLESGLPVQFIEEAAAEGLQAKRVSLGKHNVP